MQYTIKKVSGNDTTFEFTLSDNTKSTQTISGAPIDNKDALDQFVIEYLTAFEAGKVIEATPTPAVPLNVAQTITE